MGTREPGALTKAIDQMRIDLVESSDPELRTTYVDFDSLLVVLESAREIARHEVAMEWLTWGQDGDQIALEQAAIGLLSALDALDQPFEHGMPPKESEPEGLVCGMASYDGAQHCDRPFGHSEDHGSETPHGRVRWARLCGSLDTVSVGTEVSSCDLDAGHEGMHHSSVKGVSW